MFKILSLSRYKPLGALEAQNRNISCPKHSGKFPMSNNLTPLKEINAKPPLGTKIYHGDSKIFYDCGNVPNRFVEGKFVPIANNYSNEDQVAQIGESNSDNSE